MGLTLSSSPYSETSITGFFFKEIVFYSLFLAKPPSYFLSAVSAVVVKDRESGRRRPRWKCALNGERENIIILIYKKYL
jgi:hypothetical protein